MSTKKRPESALVVVYSDDDRILLLRRSDRADFWQSVTGSLEASETPLDAARREVREETGFDPHGLYECGRPRRFPIPESRRQRYPAGVTENTEHEFRLRLTAPAQPVLDPDEHDRARWCARPEALALATGWTNRAAIRLLPVEPAAATVYLVHGLWTGSPSMAILAWRFRRAGFRVRLFHYFSTREGAPAAARRLARRVAREQARVIHFVAHSLGGIVLAHLFNRGVGPRIGRVVLLGSPMQDSGTAQAMRRIGVDWALGAAGSEGLLGERPDWPAEVPVATIAGDRPVGLGRLVARIDEPHDGAVAVRETAIPGAAHLLLPVTHSGLVINRTVANRAILWLRDGILPGATVDGGVQ